MDFPQQGDLSGGAPLSRVHRLLNHDLSGDDDTARCHTPLVHKVVQPIPHSR